MGIVFALTFRQVIQTLDMLIIPLIICTDLYFLYKYLVKLLITKEKRLIIDLMALRQLYKRWEIHEICWINESINPADAFIKSTPNKVLQNFVSINMLTVKIKSYVDRN